MSAALKPDPAETKHVGHPFVHDRYAVTQRVCGLMAKGHTTESAARTCGTSASVIRDWTHQDPALDAMYARARIEQAHAFAEQCVTIADGRDPMALDDPQLRRLQVDTRKWFTAKIAPKLYGDRLETNVTVRVEALHLTALEAPALTPIVQPQLGSGETVDAEVVDASEDTD